MKDNSKDIENLLESILVKQADLSKTQEEMSDFLLVESARSTKELVKAIKESVPEIPEVKIPAPLKEITVANQIDISSIEKKLSGVEKAIKDKEYPEIDLTPVIKVLREIKDKEVIVEKDSVMADSLNKIVELLSTPETEIVQVDYTGKFDELIKRIELLSKRPDFGRYSASVEVKRIDGQQINPATEETLAAIKAVTDQLTFNSGELNVNASLEVSDIEIGAVELKDGTTNARATIESDGVDNALVVKQNSQPLPTNAAQETGGNLENFYNDFFDTLDNGFHTIRTNIISDDVGLLKPTDPEVIAIENNTFNTAQNTASTVTELQTLNAVDFATEAKQDAEAVLIGAVTETAPGTDTASSGLNGRLQRIAQNLTSYRILFYDRVAMSLESPAFISLPRSGRNPDVDTAAPEDIWNAGGTWTPITAAQTITVVSSSASDTGAGVGMRAILVTGLDASYAIATETIVLTGTTPVVSVGTWTMIHTIQGVSFGSSATNVGTITATATTDTTTQIQIAAGRGISGISFAMIPAGYTGYLKHIRGDSSSGTAGTMTTFNLMLRVFGTNGWIIPASYRARADGDASFDVELAMPYMIPEKSIIKLQAETTNNNTVVNCFYELLLKQN